MSAEKKSKIWRNLLSWMPAEHPGLNAASKEIKIWRRNLLPWMPAEHPGLRAASKEIKDLARNLLPADAGGASGLRVISKEIEFGTLLRASRAVGKEIRIWHVICCRGCRQGIRDYVLSAEKSRFTGSPASGQTAGIRNYP